MNGGGEPQGRTLVADAIARTRAERAARQRRRAALIGGCWMLVVQCSGALATLLVVDVLRDWGLDVPALDPWVAYRLFILSALTVAMWLTFAGVMAAWFVARMFRL